MNVCRVDLRIDKEKPRHATQRRGNDLLIANKCSQLASSVVRIPQVVLVAAILASARKRKSDHALEHDSCAEPTIVPLRPFASIVLDQEQQATSFQFDFHWRLAKLVFVDGPDSGSVEPVQPRGGRSFGGRIDERIGPHVEIARK